MTFVKFNHSLLRTSLIPSGELKVKVKVMSDSVAQELRTSLIPSGELKVQASVTQARILAPQNLSNSLRGVERTTGQWIKGTEVNSSEPL